MRDIAVVATAQSPAIRKEERRNEVEILMPVVHDLRDRAGLTQKDIGFTVSGSCDYLQGQAFAFVTALDAIGPWPPIDESHVEMDGAWALYEAWMRLQYGDIDTALVYSFGKSSPGDIRRILSLQLDPYYLSPLWPDPAALAELHAPFSHQEIILKRALGLGDDVNVNPSGGALGSNPVMVAGMLRIIEAAQRIMDGQADRAVAHATSGPALQQNLVAVLEGDS